MKEFILTVKALSDPTRVRILKLLEQKSHCVCELQNILEIAQPTVSRHLKVLEQAEFVYSSREGSWVNYCLKPNPSNIYAAAMIKNLGSWLNHDPSITSLISKAQTVDRNKILSRNQDPAN
ncbi:ArsR/SmtB family transcription factor [Desulfonatronovibrio hydrogenovorans]|uniref:ArsR/SmtB family transcription factor n=1 Tax=Desulfonatronovibrio hydrogenovorans TaxID=53245 RepID=UPI0004901A18|nr:metalloregulator ArsR/SmtB family transcription factor [Desulfonatronovibrio hydrogenovorans]